MSENLDIVRTATEAYIRGAFAEAIAWMDPEIEWDMSGKGRLSGTEVEQHLAQLWTLRDGKLLWMEMYPSREQALEAAEATARATE